MRLAICIGIFLVFRAVFVVGQEFSFEQITSIDGLSQSNVLGIVQDDYGYMWFATYDGLNRYDGIDFKTYKATGKENSLSSNLLTSLAVDSENDIWVGTFADGVCKFDREKEIFTQYKNSTDNPELLISNQIKSLYCDLKGNIWCISYIEGITVLIPSTDSTYEFFKIQNEVNNPASLYENLTYAVLEDSKENIWICCNNSLELMNRGDKGEIRNDFVHFINPLGGANFRNVVETKEGIIFSHYNGMILLELNPETPENPKFTNFPSVQFVFMKRDLNGNFWLGGHNGIGLMKYQPNREPLYVETSFEPVGISNQLIEGLFIRGMYIDNNGMLWFGTNGEGVLKHNTKRNWFRHYKTTEHKGSIPNNRVFTIHEDKERNIWIGTEGGGISFMPYSNKRNYKSGFKSYDVNLPGEQNFVHDIIDIKVDNKEVIWAGTGFNSLLVQLEKKNNDWSVEKIHDVIKSLVMILCEDEYGSIWIGTYNDGLYKYCLINGNRKLLHYNTTNSAIISNIIRNFCEDSLGRLWIGTDKGLLLLTREQKKANALNFKLFTNNPEDTSSINNSYCVPIIETHDNEIWIGTFGGGVNIYREGESLTDGKFARMPFNEGLPNKMVKSIVEDNHNNVWITTNKGLSRIDPARSKIRNFTTYDGLQDMQFIDLSAQKLSDGEILIGGINGFNAFYPEEIIEDTIQPKIVFNELDVMNQRIKLNDSFNGDIILPKPLNLMDTLYLNHRYNNFRIYFSAIHYVAPKGNLYKYKLENFEENWNTTTANHRVARYTNIDPGTYVFKVIAANSDGYWTSTPKTLTVIVKPAFYQTAWFITITSAFLIGLVYLAGYIRYYLIKQRSRYLEQVVELRTSETRKMNNQLKEQAKSLEEANKELDMHRNELELLVDERTKELRVAKEKAEESDILKSKFIASISHEIRTPMNSIMGFSSLLNNPDLQADKRKKYSDLVDRNGKHLIKIIDDILQFSRINTNQIEVKKKPVSLNELLDIVHVNAYNELIPGRSVGIQLNNTLTQYNYRINTDYELINRILNNLVKNAIKYTEEGFVELGSYQIDDTLYIYVKDTGIGIKKENLDTVFDSFVKSGLDEDNYTPGIGLGLTISKSLAELLGGTLSVKSEYTKGSTFTLSIPLLPEKP